MGRGAVRVLSMIRVPVNGTKPCKNHDKLITPTTVLLVVVLLLKSIWRREQVCEAVRVNLQKVLIGRFCNFSKNKTVNCHLQGVEEQTVMHSRNYLGAQGFDPLSWCN